MSGEKGKLFSNKKNTYLIKKELGNHLNLDIYHEPNNNNKILASSIADTESKLRSVIIPRAFN